MRQTLLVLTSPPASGKTFWIHSILKVIDEEKILLISPLRALANECKRNFKERIVVMTPEEWMKEKKSFPILIFDEFHLNFYWGDSFRPIMWEVFYELCERAHLCIFLTATLNLEMQNELSHFRTQFDEIIWTDFGNQKLKYVPRKYLKAPSRFWIEEYLFARSLYSNGVELIFCAYRQEVRDLSRKLEEEGYRVWHCVGGEATKMEAYINSGTLPHYIVSTTVLSHGVNLPEISSVYFLYKINNIDFWIQMVARGGRRGGKFKVFALEKPHGIKFRFGINLILLIQETILMNWRCFRGFFEQWFLKD